MLRKVIRQGLVLSAAASIAVAAAALAQDGVATSNDLSPESAVEARRALMRSIDAVMQEIEAATPADLDDLGIYSLQQRYAAVGGMLLAFPHLFPAGSDLPEPTVEEGGNPSIATPAVWTDFPSLVLRAGEAADLALTAAMTPRDGLADQAVALRAACSGCHETFMEYRSSGFGGPIEIPLDFL